MNMPICPQHTAGKCPRSQVKMLAEHGTTQATWYTSFVCQTCHHLFLEWNPAVVEAAKKQQLDREIGNIVAPERFRGLVK